MEKKKRAVEQGITGNTNSNIVKQNLLYESFKRRMEKYSDEELIQAFNNEVGNPGWTSARAAYLTAIHNEFNERGYDYSAIGNEEELSFARKVKLVGRKILPLK